MVRGVTSANVTRARSAAPHHASQAGEGRASGRGAAWVRARGGGGGGGGRTESLVGGQE